MKPTSTSAIQDNPADTSNSPAVISAAARHRVAVVIGGMIVMGSRRMGVAMRVVVMLDRITARVARMRPEYRDRARENGADQRQEDDCLNHLRAYPFTKLRISHTAH